MGLVQEEDFYKGLAASNSARARCIPETIHHTHQCASSQTEQMNAGRLPLGRRIHRNVVKVFPRTSFCAWKRIFVQQMIAALGRAQSEGRN